MAQVCTRPSFAAALCVWRCHLFPHQRTLRFLQPTSFRSISPPPPPPPPVFLSNHSLGFPRRSFCFRAATDSGAIDSNLIQSMENKIKEHLAAESVIVMDAYGDGRHVSINVISTAFEGQSAVNRQRMVYKAIWEELQNTVHAVDHQDSCRSSRHLVTVIPHFPPPYY